jgi:hypothetical protein
MAIIGLDSQVQAKLDTAICANSQIVDAVRTPRKATLTASGNRTVESGFLQWNPLRAPSAQRGKELPSCLLTRSANWRSVSTSRPGSLSVFLPLATPRPPRVRVYVIRNAERE